MQALEIFVCIYNFSFLGVEQAILQIANFEAKCIINEADCKTIGKLIEQFISGFIFIRSFLSSHEKS